MHILLKSGIAMLTVTILSACNSSDKNNNNATLHEKFTKDAYSTVEPQGKNQSEKLTGTWIMLAEGSQSTEESSLIAGKARLEDSTRSQFNAREIVRISYDKANDQYFLTSCDGLGERPLNIGDNNLAKTTYGPSLMDMQIDLSDDNEYLQATVSTTENYSSTRSAAYNLNAKLYKLSPQNNFGSFTFKGDAITPKWRQALAQSDSFEAQCFAEVQGTFTSNNYAFTADDTKHQTNGELHTFGIEGPITGKLNHNKTDASLYVEFSLHNDGKNPLQLKAGSNIYVNNNKNNATWEVAFDDWQSEFSQDEKPDIQWEYTLADGKHLNASFKAAVGSDNAFAADVKLNI